MSGKTIAAQNATRWIPSSVLPLGNVDAKHCCGLGYTVGHLVVMARVQVRRCWIVLAVDRPHSDRVSTAPARAAADSSFQRRASRSKDLTMS
jgi:hypothetical protein